MNNIWIKASARFKTLPPVYQAFILVGAALFAGNLALDLGYWVGGYLFRISH